MRWVAKHLGEDVVVNVVSSSKEKGKFATSEDVLIDDRDVCITAFREGGGIAIKHVSVTRTIEELKELL